MEEKEEYWKFAESERHFNTIQAGIRNRASTWLLAVFGAIAVLLKTGESFSWLLPTPMLVCLVSFMGTVGLLLLWINDQLVYQRLLISPFLIGLKWEHDNPKLTPIKSMMMCSSEEKSMSGWMSYYYSIPMAFLMAITFAATYLHDKVQRPIKAGEVLLDPNISVLILLILCFMQALVTIWVQFKKSTVATKDRAGLFGDESFTAMFDKSDRSIKDTLLGRFFARPPFNTDDIKETERKFGATVKKYEDRRKAEMENAAKPKQKCDYFLSNNPREYF